MKLPEIFDQIAIMGPIDASKLGKLKYNQCIPVDDVFKKLNINYAAFPFTMTKSPEDAVEEE